MRLSCEAFAFTALYCIPIRWHCVCMQIASLAADLATLQEQRQCLLSKRDALENSYRVSAIEDFGMEEETAHNNILQARSSPQKSKHLQPIHKAHGEVLLKEAEIAEAERALAAAREARSSNEAQLAAAKPADAVAKSRLDEKVPMGW